MLNSPRGCGQVVVKLCFPEQCEVLLVCTWKALCLECDVVGPGQGCDRELGRVVSRDLVWQGWSALDKVGCGGGMRELGQG